MDISLDSCFFVQCFMCSLFMPFAVFYRSQPITMIVLRNIEKRIRQGITEVHCRFTMGEYKLELDVTVLASRTAHIFCFRQLLCMQPSWATFLHFDLYFLVLGCERCIFTSAKEVMFLPDFVCLSVY